MPPVCRIMDWGKERYEQSRKERESRRNSKAITIKEDPAEAEDRRS